jgi:DNA-binding transcriptional LysR family regulator
MVRALSDSVRRNTYDRARVHLRRFEYFIAVAEELHFTRAAARLFVAQPALSQQIRALERELGAQLLRRSRHEVQLTEEGQVFLEYARDVLHRVAAAQHAVERVRSGKVSRLEVGFAPSVGGDLLPAALRLYRARHPQTDLVLSQMDTATQIQGLVRGNLDVGLLHEVAPIPDVLESMLVRREPLMIALPADHHFVARRSLSLADLRSENWIALVPHPTYRGSTLLMLCARAGFDPHIAQHALDPMTMLVFVAASAGIALVPSSSRHFRSHDVVYRPLRKPRPTHDLLVAWRKESRGELVNGFVEAIRRSARSLAKRDPRR